MGAAEQLMRGVKNWDADRIRGWLMQMCAALELRPILKRPARTGSSFAPTPRRHGPIHGRCG
jgi:hypothetical protein